jgi:hypothetical protein
LGLRGAGAGVLERVDHRGSVNGGNQPQPSVPLAPVDAGRKEHGGCRAAHMVGPFPSKREALSSNPNTKKAKKTKGDRLCHQGTGDLEVSLPLA